ncbi:lipoprotein, partial [Pseudomonas coronafaciens]
MLSHRLYVLSFSALLVCQSVSAQVMERDLGAFDLKLATTPTRSMAQGLVTPTGGSDSFHGGLDLTHRKRFLLRPVDA